MPNMLLLVVICGVIISGHTPVVDSVPFSCLPRTDEDPCPPDHEIAQCTTRGTKDKCVPCAPGLRMCDATTSTFPSECYDPRDFCSADGDNVVQVIDDPEGGCTIRCLCNERAGFTGPDPLQCQSYDQACDQSSYHELDSSQCLPCTENYHNPKDDGLDKCVLRSTSSSTAATRRPLVVLPTSTALPPQPVSAATMTPTAVLDTNNKLDNGNDMERVQFWHDNKTWILAIIFISVFLLLVLAWYCCCRGQANPCNIACCHSTAIQNSQTRTQAQESPGDPPPYTSLLDGDLSHGVSGHQPNGIPSARPNGIPGARPNGIPGARPNRIPGASPNGIPGASPNGIPGDSPNGIPGASSNGIPGARQNGIPGASPNGIPGASPNGIPGASSNGIPGASPNGIPGASPNGIPSASSNGIPGASSNGIPGASPNGIPGARPNGIPGARPNGIPSASPSAHEDAENGPNGLTGSSISGRRTPTGTADPSIRSLGGQPDTLDSGGDSTDHFLGWGPLTSEATSLNLPRQGVQDPEETGRKVPIPAQDIGTGSDVENGNTSDEVDDDNEGAQALLDGPAYGLVELDMDRDMSHVPMVQ